MSSSTEQNLTAEELLRLQNDPTYARAVRQLLSQERGQPGLFDQNRFRESMDYMNENNQKRNQFLDEEGAFGGIRQSDQNTGSQRINQSSLDWLKEGYNPRNNPAEGRDVYSKAVQSVQGMKDEQARRLQQEAEQLATSGYLTKGDTTNFFKQPGNAGADYALGKQPQADMTVMNIDPRYGGGLAMGGQSLPEIEGATQLPTGSGVPMSALEAFSTDHLGSGIYAGKDKSNPSSMDANSARPIAVQQGIKRNIKDFFNRPTPQIVADLRKSDKAPEVALDEAVAKGQLDPEQAMEIEVALRQSPVPMKLQDFTQTPIDPSQLPVGGFPAAQPVPTKSPDEILNAAMRTLSQSANANLRMQPPVPQPELPQNQGLLPRLGREAQTVGSDVWQGLVDLFWTGR